LLPPRAGYLSLLPLMQGVIELAEQHPLPVPGRGVPFVVGQGPGRAAMYPSRRQANEDNADGSDHGQAREPPAYRAPLELVAAEQTAHKAKHEAAQMRNRLPREVQPFAQQADSGVQQQQTAALRDQPPGNRTWSTQAATEQGAIDAKNGRGRP